MTKQETPQKTPERSSLGYLMGYAWIILVMTVVVAGLIALGWLRV